MSGGIIIAGTGSGCGKTTVTLALLKALTSGSLRVQPFKAGPDYIDAQYHTAVCGRTSRNLDSWLLDAGVVRRLYADALETADIGVVEGVMGYYDGFAASTAGSTYEISRLLQLPVVLVVDAKGMSHSIAAVVEGYKNLYKDAPVAGVIFNRMQGEERYRTIKSLVEARTGTTVFGYLPAVTGASFESRHLGLLLPQAQGGFSEKVERLGRQAVQTIDLERLIACARGAGPVSGFSPEVEPVRQTVRIAIARDEAFGFYYADGLELLQQLGAELIAFSPLEDAGLPDGTDALYIGGGYPECHARRLSENNPMRQAVKEAAASGMPIYGECGGFIYLTGGIWQEERFYPFAGVLEGRCEMAGHPGPFGYIELTALTDTLLLQKGGRVRAHEFHYSRADIELPPAVRASKTSYGRTKAWAGGYGAGRLLAGYPHIHFCSDPDMARRFIEAARRFQVRKYRGGNV